MSHQRDDRQTTSSSNHKPEATAVWRLVPPSGNRRRLRLRIKRLDRNRTAIHRPSLRHTIGLVIMLAAANTALAQQDYFVTAFSSGSVYRICDLNGDGDALDTGEKTLWADGLAGPEDLSRYGSGILAMDCAAGEIVRLADLNGDGDALDAGESLTWADGFTFAYEIGVGPGGLVYAGEYRAGQVWRMADANGDGDALDAGEKALYAEGIYGVRGLLPRHGDVLASSSSHSRVRRLIDLNGDGDARDAGENLIYTPSTVNGAGNLMPDRSGACYVASHERNTVYRVEDLNGDGDALDWIEVLGYADDVFGGINLPCGMAPLPEGGFLLSENGDNEVSLVRDVNRDGDALDRNEVMPFAKVSTARGLIAGIGPGPTGTMISIRDGPGTLDRAAPDFFAIVERSTVDRAVVDAALNGGNDVLISSDNPASFAPGRIVQNAGASIHKSNGGQATLTVRADENIELHGGISSTGAPLNVVLVANDPAQSHHDPDPAAGDVVIAAAVDTGGGDFSSSGMHFDGSGGEVVAGTVAMNYAGAVTIGGPFSAVESNVTADEGVYVVDGGNLMGDFAVAGDVVFGPGSVRTVRLSGSEAGGILALDTLSIDGELTVGSGTELALSWIPGTDATSMFGGTYKIAVYQTPLAGESFESVTLEDIGSVYFDEIRYDVARAGGGYAIEVALHDLLAGDVNMDGYVNLADLTIMGHPDNWGTAGNGWSQGNISLDTGGEVNYADLTILADPSNWNTKLPWLPATIEAPSAATLFVPEPDTLAMCLGVFALLLGRFWMRRSLGPKHSQLS